LWIIAATFDFAHSRKRTIRDHAYRIKEIVKSGAKMFISVADQPESYRNEPYQKLWVRVSYILIALEVNEYILHKCAYTVYKCLYAVHTAHIYCTGPYIL
jgi:hypothetical protein